MLFLIVSFKMDGECVCFLRFLNLIDINGKLLIEICMENYWFVFELYLVCEENGKVVIYFFLIKDVISVGVWVKWRIFVMVDNESLNIIVDCRWSRI